MQPSLPISGVVIARNEADRIGRCLASLHALCREIVVLDSGSSDDTVAIARALGARVEHQDWLGYSAQKNAAIARAREPWILTLDADEWLDPDAEPALRALFSPLPSGSAPIESADAWQLLRRTHFLGRPLHFGGWGREATERLFRSDLRYLPLQVHEKLDLAGRRSARVEARIEHDTARSPEEYREKLARYALLFAQQKHAAGKRASALSPFTHAAAYWLKNYVFRGGFLDGREGRIYHRCHTRYVFDKYRHLQALGR
jgi:(heptosyl)LPS beta-1,4-glucosyltransferase